MTDNNDKLLHEGVLSEVSSRKQKPAEKTRVDAALGNMRTHLYLDRNKPVWVSVDKADLEVILDYVQSLKLAPAEALEDFADVIGHSKEEGLDEHTLREVALEARNHASKLRTSK